MPESNIIPSEEILKLKMVEDVYVLLNSDKDLYASLYSRLSRWLLQKAPWIVPIPGTTKLSHLEENLRTLEFAGSSEEWKELENVIATIPITGDRYNKEQQKQVGY